jgi:signal transduction histidine kinase
MALDLRGRRARLQLLVDVGVATVVLLLSLLPLLRDGAGACDCEPVPPWGYALVAAQAATLLWRRRFPFLASAACGVLTSVYGLSTLPDPPVPYAGLVAVYSAAAYASRRLALLTAVIVAVSITVSVGVDWPESDLEDAAVMYPVFATAWLLGDSARTRRERAGELEERAAQAERTRAAEAERAVVAERNRIAREMHDVVAHHVSLMVVQAEAGPVVIGRHPARAVEAFTAISATGKQALVEMRRLLGVLRDDAPGERSPQPGLARLDEIVDGVRAAGMRVDVEIVGEERALPSAVDLSAFRLLQEALTNATRHAQASRITVRVAYGPDVLELDVVDDGVGSGSAGGSTGGDGAAPDGHGLVAMRERVSMLDGTIAVGPAEHGGWAVSVRLPTAESRGETAVGPR